MINLALCAWREQRPSWCSALLGIIFCLQTNIKNKMKTPPKSLTKAGLKAWLHGDRSASSGLNPSSRRASSPTGQSGLRYYNTAQRRQSRRTRNLNVEGTPAVAVKRVVRHDFTTDACRWGWTFLNAYPRGENQWNAMFVGRGIKDGDEIALTTKTGVAIFEASNVKYDDNPPDLMTCRITTKQMPNVGDEPSHGSDPQTPK